MAWNRDLNRKVPRSLELAIFAIGLLWLLASRAGADSAAQGICGALHVELLQPLLHQVFLILLLLTGFTALHWVALRNGSLRQTNGLPSRATAGKEWQKGAALGWALLLVAMLPCAMVGYFHPQFQMTIAAWGGLLLSVATLLLAALATEMAFRGFLFQRLMRAIGPVAATLVLSLIFAVLTTGSPNSTRYSFLVAIIGGVLFSLAYLRTHALWWGWGMRFGWLVSMGVLFGLPVGGYSAFSSVVLTVGNGPDGLTGGFYGPEGSLWTAIVLLVAMVVLYTVTTEYAWDYTHEPITAGGYPVEVQPPAAHAAMEAAPQPLVQILGSTPSGFAATGQRPTATEARPAGEVMQSLGEERSPE